MASVENIKQYITPIVVKESEKLKRQKLLSTSLAYLVVWALTLLFCYQAVRWTINAYYKFPLIYDAELKAHNDHLEYYNDWCTSSLVPIQEQIRRQQTQRCLDSAEYIQAFVMARAIGTFILSEINDKLGFIVNPLISCSRNWLCLFGVAFWFAERIGKDWIFPLASSIIITLAAVVSRYSYRWIKNSLSKTKALQGDLPTTCKAD